MNGMLLAKLSKTQTDFDFKSQKTESDVGHILR
jgi:hypothetical protein